MLDYELIRQLVSSHPLLMHNPHKPEHVSLQLANVNVRTLKYWSVHSLLIAHLT